MPEPTGPPEQVYRDAALALLGAQGYHLSRSTQHALAASRQRDPGFRAAVALAWTAGILAAQRAALVAMEQDRQRWGPTKAASGVYDMCRQVVRRTLDEMAHVDG